MGRVDGYFFYRDGVPCLCSDDDSVRVKLNFDYAPELEAEMAQKEGFNYGLLCVFTIDEAWEENVTQMRRIRTTDEDYYTNYTIYPLAVLSCAAVDETMVSKQVVDVKYVNPSGIVSKTPQDGVNIIVTTHNDGSRTITKHLNK